MKLSARLTCLVGPLIVAGTVEAEFTGLVVVQKPNPFALTYNIYATFDVERGDFVFAVAGTPGAPLSVNVHNGTFYQNEFGGDTAPNSALFAAFPSLQFDTFVTIGKKTDAGDATALAPGFPGFEDGPLYFDSSGWFITPDDPQGNPNAGGQVLLAQLSTQDGWGFYGTILVSGFNAGVSFQEVVTFDVGTPPPPDVIAFYTDAVGFDSALVQATMAATTLWDFRPHDLKEGSAVGLDDPLDIDTHVLNPDDPWGDLWPAALDNVQFSSNMTPGEALTPRGANGLAFLSSGFLGGDSDILAANFLADGLTVRTGVPHGLDVSAVALDVVKVLGSGTLQLLAFDANDILMGATQISVTAGQSTFLGMIGTGEIARIDIHDPAGGIEGIVSIALYRDNCVFFTTAGEFEKFNDSQGKALAGMEDFEESNLAPNGAAQLPDPLQSNVPNVESPGNIGFPFGLTQNGLIIQANITSGASPPDPNPSDSPEALLVIGPGFFGADSHKVGAYFGAGEASLDVILYEYCPWDCGDTSGHVGIGDLLELLQTWGLPGACDIDESGTVGITDLVEMLAHWGSPPECTPPVPPIATAIGLELSRVTGDPATGWYITVYDRDNVEIGEFAVPGPGALEPTKVFVGVSAISPIGRVNIYDEAALALDCIDDIQLWE